MQTHFCRSVVIVTARIVCGGRGSIEPLFKPSGSLTRPRGRDCTQEYCGLRATLNGYLRITYFWMSFLFFVGMGQVGFSSSHGWLWGCLVFWFRLFFGLCWDGERGFFVVGLCWMGGMRMGKFIACIIFLPINPVKKSRLAILP
jgi:hypothetical protein